MTQPRLLLCVVAIAATAVLDGSQVDIVGTCAAGGEQVRAIKRALDPLGLMNPGKVFYVG